MPDFKNNFLQACKKLWKQLFAEFIGTFFLVLVGCGSTIGSPFNTSVTFLEIALCFGLTVGVIVHIISHISGGHINPAVTVGMLVTRKIPIINGILYIIVQLAGGIAGSALLLATLPSNKASSMGQTTVNDGISVIQGLIIEFFITFLLVFAVFMVFDPRKPECRHEPLVIGLVVAVCHIWAIKFTGASMNTARSFGPALIGNVWEHHWIYWVGPLAAGLVAGLLYKFIFEPHASSVGKTEHQIEDVEKQTVSDDVERQAVSKDVEKQTVSKDVEKQTVPEDVEKQTVPEDVEKMAEEQNP